MTTEEEIKKAEQEVNRAKKKLAEAKRKAQKEKRAEENSRKFMMGGLVAKYLREDMALDFMDFSEEEITRIVACGMKQRDTRNMVQKVISERLSSWIFNLVATIMFTVSLIGLCMGGITKMECLKYLAVAFGVFIVPFLGEGLIMVILEIRLRISDWLW